MDPETRFRAVFGLAYAPLCRYARHRGLTGPDMEDLVAQTLEIAWRRIDEVPEAEPLPWLYAVAHNLWRNQTRRDRRRRALLARFRTSMPVAAGEDPAGSGGSAGAGGSGGPGGAELAGGPGGGLGPGVLRAALASLSESDQEALRLVAWDGLTPAQVAVVLGCSPAAARTRLHRARGRLAARLGMKRSAPSGQGQGDSADPVEVPR